MDADERLVDESLSKLGGHTRKRNRNAILAFLSWTKNHGDFASLEEIIKFQEKTTGRDRYRLGDLIETHDRELGGSTNTMRWRNAILRGFFERLHVEMPKQRFNFVPTKDTSQSLLSEEVVRTLLNECDLEDRVVYISLYQSMMDQHRFFSVVNPLGFEIAQHLKEKGPSTPFKIDCRRGRKNNLRPYYTFLGFDALTAIKEYFDRKRGWPSKPGEPLLVSQRNTPLSKYAFYQSHYRRVERLGYHKQNNGSTRAHGFGPHNFRDLAKTVLHLKGKKDGIDMAWVDFALGHTVDKLGYDQFFKDEEYTLNQFRIAEKYLNIVSHVEHPDIEKIAGESFKKQIGERDAKIADLEQRLAKAEKEKPDLDKYFEENIEDIIKKFNKYGVDMKIRKSKRV